MINCGAKYFTALISALFIYYLISRSFVVISRRNDEKYRYPAASKRNNEMAQISHHNFALKFCKRIIVFLQCARYTVCCLTEFNREMVKLILEIVISNGKPNCQFIQIHRPDSHGYGSLPVILEGKCPFCTLNRSRGTA